MEDKMFKDYCTNFIIPPHTLDPVDRIIAIGDLHGDWKLTLKCLIIAKVIKLPNGLKLSDEKIYKILPTDIEWIGQKTVVVQVGDQVDRCRPKDKLCIDQLATRNDENSDIQIVQLFSHLAKEAEKVGGVVISLLGNHEIMNVMGNMSYVSFKGLVDFVDEDTTDITVATPEMIERRVAAFERGGDIAKELACTRNIAVIIGSWIFVHGGFTSKVMENSSSILKNGDLNKHTLHEMNDAIRIWLLGHMTPENIQVIINSDKNSPFWNRVFGRMSGDSNENDIEINREECDKYLKDVFESFQVGHMVIGHTPQFSVNKEGINSTCEGRVWRVDHGGSDAFTIYDKDGKYNQFRKAQVLEILKDGEEVRVLVEEH